MPVMDGFEATRKIRLSKNSVPVIAVTANSRDIELPRCIDAGMNDFLCKPVKVALLKELLEKYC